MLKGTQRLFSWFFGCTSGFAFGYSISHRVTTGNWGSNEELEVLFSIVGLLLTAMFVLISELYRHESD